MCIMPVMQIIHILLSHNHHSDGYVDSSLYSAYFGEGTGPIHMNNLGCSGTEYRLKDCSYSEGSDRHSQDWSITCNNGIHDY